MLSSAQTLAPKPTLPPAAPPAAPANAAQPPGGPSFAQFLTEQASLTAPSAEPSQAEAEPSQPATNAAARRNAQPAKPAAQARPAEAKAEAKPAPADKTEGQPATEAVAPGADDEDGPETPELKEFTQLLGLATPQPDTAAKPDLHRPRATAAAADDTSRGRDDKRTLAADAGRTVDVAQSAQAKAADTRADQAAAREPLQSTHNAAQPEAAQGTATPAATTPNFAAALAQALPPSAAPADGAPVPAQAGVQAPLHSPAFAPELGARVSLLAVDGIQQAELQLNPADMGPVSVQIVVDGSQAQVSFHAVQAETRQALEQSLPDLAAALQGQGLTLSGGGVFQQASRDADHGQDGSGQGNADAGSRSASAQGAAGNTGAAAPARRTVGLLDTFA